MDKYLPLWRAARFRVQSKYIVNLYKLLKNGLTFQNIVDSVGTGVESILHKTG